MSLVPEDLLGRVVILAIDGEVGVAVVGEVTLLVDAEAGGAGALGGSTGVRAGQTNGADLVGDDVEALEASGS